MQRVLLVLLLLLAAVLAAKPVSPQQAARVAENWMLERTGQRHTDSSITPLDPQSPLLAVSLNPSGFVLIAGDDAAFPILGYGSGHAWGERPVPVQLQAMLDGWISQLRDIGARNLQPSLESALLWQRYDKPPSDFQPNRNFRDVAPLLSTTWGQEGYYNELCPEYTPVGCVATAMSQIMRYWSFPVTGQGSHSYTHPDYGTLSADFGATVYNWTAMPNQVGSPNLSVATLCFHAGVAVEMNYDPTGSGAYSWAVDDALKNYFRYAGSTAYYDRSSYSDATWANMLRNEFDSSRPVYYSGYGVGGGHAFVLDGYQGTDHFHVNWGWDGYYNGFYTLGGLNPGSYSFNGLQAAVMGIAPTQSGPSLNEGFEDSAFPPEGWSSDSGSWTRQTSSAITGTASARYSGSANNVKLITPLVSLTAESSISFSAKRSTNRNEVLDLMYSADGSGWATLYTTPILSTTATTYTAYFSGVAPGDYYLAFNARSSTGATQTKTIYLDGISGPALANAPVKARINLGAWDAGNVAPGIMAASGQVFQLSNIGGGILQITGVTDLTGTEFSCSLNRNAQLVYGQVHEFGFGYEPVDYGTDALSFQIVTTGGTITVNLTGSASGSLFADDFENYADFTLNLSPWTQYDIDGSPTYGLPGCTYPNRGYTGAFMAFNSSQTSPSLAGTAADAQSGLKGAYCFAGNNLQNNDWLVTPQLSLIGPTCTVSFWAKSYTDNYGLERFKVRYSTTNNAVASFTNYLAGSSTAYVSAPVDWAFYSYILPVNAKYVAIQCVSAEAFIFMVDNFSITDSGQNPPPPAFGHLSGYVRAAGTSNPVPNAVVVAGQKSCVTNASGFYQINNLPAGTYSVGCSTPGQDFFTASASGITISLGVTAAHDFDLTWAELEVNSFEFAANLYLGQNEDQTLIVSNPGGTANLEYSWRHSPYSGDAAATCASGTLERALPADPAHKVAEHVVLDNRVSVECWMSYGDVEDYTYYTTYAPERATRFSLGEWGLWSDAGVTVTQLQAYFYEPGADLWGSEDSFRFKVYAADGSTLLYSSPNIVAQRQFGPTTFILPEPLTIAGDFYVAIAPEGTVSGKPYGLSTGYSRGKSYFGSPGAWTALAEEEHLISVFAEGGWWVFANPATGVVAPGSEESVTLSFDTQGLRPGTYSGLLTIFNNSNYIAPSGSIRGDDLSILLTLNVSDPPLSLDPPQNLALAPQPEQIVLTWDPVPNASSYAIYGSSDPRLPTGGAFDVLILRTSDPGAEITWARLAQLGLDAGKVFFQIMADTESP